MNPLPCNVCGSFERKALFSRDGFVIVRCSVCGLGFVDPQPAPESIGEFYNEKYRDRALPSPAKRRAKLREAERTVRRVERFLRGRDFRIIRHLDIGCSFGYLTAVARRWGWYSTGTDLSRWQVEYARRVFDVPAEVLPFPGSNLEKGRFQVITLLEVLEHLPDPRKALEEVRDLLSERGILVVKVPDFGHPRAARRGERWRGVVLPDHLFYFTRETLVRSAQQAGLRHVGMFPRAPWREMLTAVFEKPAMNPQAFSTSKEP